MVPCWDARQGDSAGAIASRVVTQTLLGKKAFADSFHVFTAASLHFHMKRRAGGGFPSAPSPFFQRRPIEKHRLNLTVSYFGRGGEKESGSQRAIQNLLKPQRAHKTCVRCLDAKWLFFVIFVVPRFEPAPWNDNGGGLWRTQTVWVLNWGGSRGWGGFIGVEWDLFTANYLESKLPLGALASRRRQSKRLCGVADKSVHLDVGWCSDSVPAQLLTPQYELWSFLALM